MQLPFSFLFDPFFSSAEKSGEYYNIAAVFSSGLFFIWQHEQYIHVYVVV